MEFLYILETIRNPVLDALFSVITYFGDELLFMVVGMIVLWCADKRQGYYLLTVGLFGTVVNQFLKMFFRIPRPWQKDADFTIVESAKEAASGYSFPSGHTQISVGLYGGIARWNRQRLLRIIGTVMCVLIPFSRMYLGVHTPADVFTSVVIALVLVFGFYPVFKKGLDKPWVMYAAIGVTALALTAHICYLNFYPFPDSVYTQENIGNLLSAKENAATLLGCTIGLFAVYFVDEKYTHFPTKAPWWAQLIKVGAGLTLAIGVRAALKAPLNAIIPNEYIARGVRYFLMVIVIGVLWPMTFKHFEKMDEDQAAKG